MTADTASSSASSASSSSQQQRQERTVRLTVITDFVCICCAIGQHELHTAISTCTSPPLSLPLRFEIEHVPFRLICPGALPAGAKEDREAFLEKSLGKERYEVLRGNVMKWAGEKGVGITLKGTMSPTTNAHRLVLKAGQLHGQTTQQRLIDALFASSMQRGEDIDSSSILSALAVECGVWPSEGAARAFVEGDELGREVEEMMAAARAKGVTGVPMVIIDGKWAVSGGQSSEVYVQIFKKLATCQGAQCAVTPIPDGVESVDCTQAAAGCVQ